MDVTSGHFLAPSVPCQVLHPNMPQLPCAYLIFYLQSRPTRRQQRSWNIFLSPCPLASLACAEVSLSHLHDIHERHKLSLGNLQPLAWKRGYTRQPFMAYHLITKACISASLSEALFKCLRLLQVFGAKNTSKGKKVIFSLKIGRKWASEK